MSALKKSSVVFLLAIFLLGYNTSCTRKNTAKAVIESASGSSLTGEAVFEETGAGIKLILTVKGAVPGTHAVHLHEKGDCSANDATSAGGHWNPTNVPHGNRAEGGTYHKGDIANMEVSDDGTGKLEITAGDWSIGGSEDSNILDKAVIIHANADDFVSQPAGNAGARIGCGVIKKSE